ncbi:MAG: hypothetical protein AB1564_13895 [Chloroflexota bacterium]
MKIKPILQSQYLAALAMLKQAIVKCPPEAWDDPRDKDRFWFVAYHTLRYAHLYLKAQDKGYVRWEARRHDRPGLPFTKEEILQRLALVEKDAMTQIRIMDLDEDSMPGLANKFELQLYNLRHIQQHVGELYQRLSPYNLKLEWASQRYKRPRA